MYILTSTPKAETPKLWGRDSTNAFLINFALFWLKTTKICYLTVYQLEFQNMSHLAKIKVSVELSFLEILGKNVIPCFFQLLEATCFP